MLRLLTALILVLPFVELWTAVVVAQRIGFALTLSLLVLMSLAGMWLLRREGTTIWRRANAEMAAGRTPAAELLDATLVFIGAMLLILPGFITGAIGLVLLLPPARAALRPALLAWLGARAARAASSGRLIINTTGFAAGGFGPADPGVGHASRDRSSPGSDVIDADGWDVDGGSELPRGRDPRTGPQ